MRSFFQLKTSAQLFIHRKETDKRTSFLADTEELLIQICQARYKDVYCHYERLFHKEVEFIGPSCQECQGCLIGGEVMLDENGICPPEYQHFLDFDEETGAPIWVNNCTCEVILEPIGGDGNFDVTKVINYNL